MLSKTDSAYLSVARFAAAKSEARNTHGAVIVKGGRVLAIGYNKHRNDPVFVSPEHIKTDCSRCAEMVAIKGAGTRNVKGAVIYVARVNNQGVDRNSKPCPRCQTLIERVGIKRVVYTTENGERNVSY